MNVLDLTFGQIEAMCDRAGVNADELFVRLLQFPFDAANVLLHLSEVGNLERGCDADDDGVSHGDFAAPVSA